MVVTSRHPHIAQLRLMHFSVLFFVVLLLSSVEALSVPPCSKVFPSALLSVEMHLPAL